jgi:hypothetical protein
MKVYHCHANQLLRFANGITSLFSQPRYKSTRILLSTGWKQNGNSSQDGITVSIAHTETGRLLRI